MKITSKGKYALIAVLDILNHSKGSPVRMSDIAKRQELSLYYLGQIMRKLRQGGVVTSVMGPSGGYLLKKKSSEITILKILVCVENFVEYSDSIKQYNKKSDSPEYGLLYKLLEKIDDCILDQILDKLTLEDVEKLQ